MKNWENEWKGGMEKGQGVQGIITALKSAFTVLHLLGQHNTELFKGPREAQRVRPLDSLS